MRYVFHVEHLSGLRKAMRFSGEVFGISRAYVPCGTLDVSPVFGSLIIGSSHLVCPAQVHWSVPRGTFDSSNQALEMLCDLEARSAEFRLARGDVHS